MVVKMWSPSISHPSRKACGFHHSSPCHGMQPLVNGCSAPQEAFQAVFPTSSNEDGLKADLWSLKPRVRAGTGNDGLETVLLAG